jgi:hypothetical protein
LACKVVQDEHEVPQDCAQRAVRKAMASITVDQRIVEDWSRDIQRDVAGSDRTYDHSCIPKVADLPCRRAWISFYLALLKRIHGKNAKPRKGDRYDLNHYVCSAQANCFVTTDKPMRDICSLIEWKPVPVIDLAEFSRVVLSLETGGTLN